MNKNAPRTASYWVSRIVLVFLIVTTFFPFVMLINMSLGGFMGSFIPFTLKKFGLDPASGSSIFATGCTDTGGFFIFLGLGALFLL